MTHRHWYNIYIYNNWLKRLNWYANRPLIVFDWNVTSKIRDRRFVRVKYPSGHRRLKKITTSYDQTRRGHNFWKKTSDLRRLEDVWFMTSWRRLIYDAFRTSGLWRLKDVWFTSFWDVQFRMSWKRLIYNVSRTSGLRRLEDVRFTSSWRRSIYDVLKTSDLWRLEDIWLITFWRRL